MNIVLDGIVIRDFQRKDAEPLYKIVRESEIIRFMKDWSENAPTPEDFYGYIDWLQTKKDSTDVYEIKQFIFTEDPEDKDLNVIYLLERSSDGLPLRLDSSTVKETMVGCVMPKTVLRIDP